MKPLDEMIAVMQASKTKEIEWRSVEGAALNYPEWQLCCPAPRWDWNHYDYRVKAQEPRRIWVNEFSCGVMSCFKEKFVAEGFHNASNFIRCDEFIELTPEVREKLGL